jgi:hypothetical protein
LAYPRSTSKLDQRTIELRARTCRSDDKNARRKGSAHLGPRAASCPQHVQHLPPSQFRQLESRTPGLRPSLHGERQLASRHKARTSPSPTPAVDNVTTPTASQEQGNPLRPVPGLAAQRFVNRGKQERLRRWSVGYCWLLIIGRALELLTFDKRRSRVSKNEPLMSYSVSFPNLHFRVAAFVDKIFKGGSPADSPWSSRHGSNLSSTSCGWGARPRHSAIAPWPRRLGMSGAPAPYRGPQR